ncbi:hypothetical protein RvY_11699 [Ramazzottius varieornatus]|uniref:Uncharacterized protein n=1 Tax=Ramazzottius varieornatus TaxID=947166 RepID=A0A1D1VGY7_RAMVA|nr:hypothetical protein RvY_11699 [Ramazzottius varieornatus]
MAKGKLFRSGYNLSCRIEGSGTGLLRENDDPEKCGDETRQRRQECATTSAVSDVVDHSSLLGLISSPQLSGLLMRTLDCLTLSGLPAHIEEVFDMKSNEKSKRDFTLAINSYVLALLKAGQKGYFPSLTTGRRTERIEHPERYAGSECEPEAHTTTTNLSPSEENTDASVSRKSAQNTGTYGSGYGANGTAGNGNGNGNGNGDTNTNSNVPNAGVNESTTTSSFLSLGNGLGITFGSGGTLILINGNGANITTIGPSVGLVLNGATGGTGFNTGTGVETVGGGTRGVNSDPGVGITPTDGGLVIDYPKRCCKVKTHTWTLFHERPSHIGVVIRSLLTTFRQQHFRYTTNASTAVTTFSTSVISQVVFWKK